MNIDTFLLSLMQLLILFSIALFCLLSVYYTSQAIPWVISCLALGYALVLIIKEKAQHENK
jgi:hypothetical protein